MSNETRSGLSADAQQALQTCWRVASALKGQRMDLAAQEVRTLEQQCIVHRSVPEWLADPARHTALHCLGAPPPRFSTGMERLDRMLGGGYRAGELTAVVGPPKVSKSGLVTQFVLHALSDESPCLYISTEMSRRAVLSRCLAQKLGDISYSEVHDQLHLRDDWQRLLRSLETGNLYTAGNDEWVPSSAEEIRQNLTIWISHLRAKNANKPPLVFIDHLGDLAYVCNPQDTISGTQAAVYLLMSVARREQVPIVLAHHLSRQSSKELTECTSPEDFARLFSTGAASSSAVERKMAQLIGVYSTPRSDGESRADGVLCVSLSRWGSGGNLSVQVDRRCGRFYEVLEPTTEETAQGIARKVKQDAEHADIVLRQLCAGMPPRWVSRESIRGALGWRTNRTVAALHELETQGRARKDRQKGWSIILGTENEMTPALALI